jgi:hypothetical protein
MRLARADLAQARMSTKERSYGCGSFRAEDARPKKP